MAEHPRDITALRALLPLAANGTLTRDQHAELEAAMAQHPTLRHELRWLQTLRDTVQAEPLDALPDGDLGWARLQQRLGDAPTAPSPRAARGPASDTWAERWRRWLQAHALPVFATACALLVAQGVIVAKLLQEHPTYQAAGGGTTATTTGVLLHATVRPGVSEARWRETLLQQQASIVEGPSALGIYTLRLPPPADGRPRAHQARESASRLLQDAGEVFDSVTPADRP